MKPLNPLEPDRTQPLLVGIDVGTSNVKAAVFTPNGVLKAECSRPTPTHVPGPGQAFYHAEELWAAVAQVLRSVLEQLEDPTRVVGVAVASMGEAGVPLDAQGQPTAETLAWFDPRTGPQAQHLERVIGRERLFTVTGLTPLPVYGLPKVLWLHDHRPEAYGRTVRWLHIADYIAYRLCGTQATDFSLASRTLAFDLGRRRWDPGILRELDIDSELFAPLVESGTRLGGVTPEASSATGLPLGVAVSAGGQDHVCGALAVGVTGPGETLNSLGTAEVMFVSLEGRIFEPQFAALGYAQGAHVLPGRYYAFGAMFSSGASVDWVRKLLGAASSEEYAALLQEAATVPPGSLGTTYLPHLHIGNAPHEDPQSRGAFVGLRPGSTRAALLRAVLEGLAFESRQSLEGLSAFLNTPPRRITAIGGSTRNALLLEIKASVLGREIQVSSASEAVCLGASLLAGVGAGVYPSVQAASEAVQDTRTSVQPNFTQVPYYQAHYQTVFQLLYDALRPLNHALAALEPSQSSP